MPICATTVSICKPNTSTNFKTIFNQPSNFRIFTILVDLRLAILLDKILVVGNVVSVANTECAVGHDVAILVPFLDVHVLVRPLSLMDVPAEFINAMMLERRMLKTSFGKLGHRQRGGACPPRTNHRIIETNRNKNTPGR